MPVDVTLPLRRDIDYPCRAATRDEAKMLRIIHVYSLVAGARVQGRSV